MKIKGRKQAEKRGRRAEWLAAMFLRLKGYKVLETRFKTSGGEIDIIAKMGQTLVAVEVKQRPNLQLSHDALTATGLRRIENAAAAYQENHANLHELDLRFDAIFVLPNLRIHHLKDAWRAY